MKKNGLIIGAGGFIGFNLCKKLVGKYQTLYACDTFFSAPILEQLKTQQIEIIEGGVEGFLCFQQKYRHIEDIFYFAGSATPALTETELSRGCFPDQEMLVMLLSSFDKMQHKIRFIYGSSGGTIYGESIDNLSCKETMTCQPISAYGLSKLLQEQYIQFFARKFQFNYYIARISNPYGRIISHNSKQLQGFIDNAIHKTLHNETIEIWGSQKIIRDFIHIDDLVAGIWALVKQTIPEGIYNIGSGEAHSLGDIINILQSLQKDTKVTLLESRHIDLKNNVLSINKLHKASHWQPTISLSEGIKLVLSQSR